MMSSDTAVNQAWIIGLVIGCPMGQPLSDCIIQPLRCIPLDEAHAYVKALSGSELEDIIQRHKRCLAERER